jgi:pimeloyl-ACP methyl ester carboxylesterase
MAAVVSDTGTMTTAIRQGQIRANGLEFAYLEAGEGPLVLLLHGFPDNAWTWEHQIPALAAAGYRAVAPFLRGYPPSEIPVDGFFDRATLALDLKGLIEALNDGQPCDLVAQDWGAAIAYGALAAFPELVRRAVLMAIPHPAVAFRSMTSPVQIHRAFHWWFFQLPTLPEQMVPADDFAFIDYLWEQWSPGHTEQAHVARIKQTLAQPGAVTATINYYRALLNPALQDPALDELRARLDGRIPVPTLALCGADDLRAEPMATQAGLFTGLYRFDVVPDCGHFLHRERPEDINRRILAWLKDT